MTRYHVRLDAQHASLRMCAIAADFVEDDDGMGYVDVGEEDYWGAEQGDAEEDEEHPSEPDAKRQKIGKQDKGASIFQGGCSYVACQPT